MVSFRSFHSALYYVFAATWGICSRSCRPPNTAFTWGFDTVLIRSIEWRNDGSRLARIIAGEGFQPSTFGL